VALVADLAEGAGAAGGTVLTAADEALAAMNVAR
jgi:hypothetical protein